MKFNLICFCLIFSSFLLSCSEMRDCDDLELSSTCSINLFVGEWEYLGEENDIKGNICLSNLSLPKSSNENRIFEESDLYLSESTDNCKTNLKGSQFLVPPTEILLIEANHIKITTRYWVQTTIEIFRRKL